MRLNFFKVFLTTFLLSLAVVSCSTPDPIDVNSAEKAFKEAKEYEDDERYEEALRRYDEIKNKFPYSQYSKESDLRIADIYFKKEEFASAALSYSNFKYLYPNHPQIPYVSLQLALSYFNQLPKTIDRDLSKGVQAIQEFNIVLDKYPGTDFAKTAAEKKKATQDMLAKKESYIANWYFKKEKYLSAMRRFENLTKMPAPAELTSEAYLKGAISALEIGEVGKGKSLLEQLSKKFPTSDNNDQISDVKSKYGI